VIISDANAITGVTALTVDNTKIDGDTISNTAGNVMKLETSAGTYSLK
jgi:hypothetical protein